MGKIFIRKQYQKKRHIRIATEGALIGSIAEHGLAQNIVIISDDAGQFNVFLHGLCWVHAERLIGKIVPYTEQAAEDLKNIRSRIWVFYDQLKEYKQQHSPEYKKQLEAEFDDIFNTHRKRHIEQRVAKTLQ